MSGYSSAPLLRLVRLSKPDLLPFGPSRWGEGTGERTRAAPLSSAVLLCFVSLSLHLSVSQVRQGHSFLECSWTLVKLQVTLYSCPPEPLPANAAAQTGRSGHCCPLPPRSSACRARGWNQGAAGLSVSREPRKVGLMSVLRVHGCLPLLPLA